MRHACSLVGTCRALTSSRAAPPLSDGRRLAAAGAAFLVSPAAVAAPPGPTSRRTPPARPGSRPPPSPVPTGTAAAACRCAAARATPRGCVRAVRSQSALESRACSGAWGRAGGSRGRAGGGWVDRGACGRVCGRSVAGSGAGRARKRGCGRENWLMGTFACPPDDPHARGPVQQGRGKVQKACYRMVRGVSSGRATGAASARILQP